MNLEKITFKKRNIQLLIISIILGLFSYGVYLIINNNKIPEKVYYEPDTQNED